MLGFTNEYPLDAIFSDVFDIVIVWFGVKARAETGKVNVFSASTDAGRAPKTVKISRRLLIIIFVLAFASSSSAKSSPRRRCCCSSSSSSDEAPVVVVSGPFLRAAVLVFLSLRCASLEEQRRRLKNTFPVLVLVLVVAVVVIVVCVAIERMMMK